MRIDINRIKDEEDIKMLKELKWNGFVFYQYDYEFDKELFEKVKSIGESYKLKVYSGVKIKTENPKELRKKVKKFRNKCHIILVEGGILKINRASVEMHDVDILSTPELGRKDSGIDHVLARLASTHRVAIEINLKNLLSKDGYERARTLLFFRNNLKLAKKYDVPVVISTDAENKYQIKNPYDLRAFLNTLVDVNYSKKIMETTYKICEFRDYLMKDNVVRYGVEIIKE
ncbi:ribonuclease P protein component 3 [Methanocaldococcus sp.]|uniref:ribonuclease P protein component 3 n=1 Tax=Methanocaldococcus sp. TaxID=2152917 RepID=UPI0026287F42|nr:RNase P subunit p30 family protein [Methanocaldococcus sp.]MCQ6254602.1 ribonuclease P [Methanocaldococcus sp.]